MTPKEITDELRKADGAHVRELQEQGFATGDIARHLKKHRETFLSHFTPFVAASLPTSRATIAGEGSPPASPAPIHRVPA